MTWLGRVTSSVTSRLDFTDAEPLDDLTLGAFALINRRY
jgi:hypothetical protein